MRKLFQIFVKYNISISLTKTFLSYPNINLLSYKVDSLGIATPEDKLKAIRSLSYPTTLGDLKHYLSLANYLRNYVYHFAQLAQPLQVLKILLLKQALNKGNPRRIYTLTHKLIEPTAL